jgi:hypothetical protein
MVVQLKIETTNKRFLFHLLSFSDLSETITGTAQPGLSVMNILPVPIFV